MRLAHLLDLISELLGNIICYWNKSDTERVQNIQHVRKKVLECHDDVLVDSSKNHLLLCTQEGFYLVSRRSAWKARLSERDVTLYEKRGRGVFARIERNRKTKRT